MRSVVKLCELAESSLDHANWYLNARREIQEVAKAMDVPFNRFCDVLAILSPRCSVVRNVRKTLHYLRTGKHLVDTVKSVRLSLLHYENSGEIGTRKNRAHKIRNFAAALKGDMEVVVLDTHMANALCVDQLEFNRNPVRLKAEFRVSKTAELFNLYPAECQAAIWAGQCRRAGINVGTFNLLEEYRK